MHPGVIHRRFLNDLSSSLFSFVLPLLPTNEELTVKEEVRGLIEKLIKTIEPSARLLSFGSSCNSFGLRNSDMDLVVLIDDPDAGIESSHFVAMVGDLLERETNFVVKPLPKARIPILKLNLAPSPALPFGIACDIGIENRLAIENTRLLLTYATIDPARVRTLVLFLKVWAKRRRINSPYRGTLSSYGFTLMVLYYLVHVKQPPVLPNLQRIAPLTTLTEDQVMLDGRNIYFFDNVEILRREWSSINYETVGELLIDFFRFFSHDFQFNNQVLSLRAGPLTKESKGWVNDIDVGGLNEMARDRNRLCIEDPFEITYNVARTVTKDGLYTIRGEFMRATRILTQRPDRAVLALAELCREREDDLHRAPRSSSPVGPPRAMSASRGNLITPPPTLNGSAWRSQSHTPFDRVGASSYDTPSGASTRGRGSNSAGGADFSNGNSSAGGGGADFSAQDLWLASQGTNLGGVGGLGLGFPETPFSAGTRGRDTAARGLETPGGQFPRPSGGGGAGGGSGGGRRGLSNFDADNGGSGSVSAPLSPHRLYAQLEMGKGPAGTPSGWPTFDSRQLPSGAPMPVGSNTSVAGYRSVSRTAGASSQSTPGQAYAKSSPSAPGAAAVQTPVGSTGSSSHSKPNPSTNANASIKSTDQTLNPKSNHLPSFQPFSPAVPTSTLRHLHGEPSATAFISPSTLLSPPTGSATLPPLGSSFSSGIGADKLAQAFDKLGVDGPGAGAENDGKARVGEEGAKKVIGSGASQ